MERAFNIYRENDREACRIWLMECGIEEGAVGKIISALTYRKLHIIDVEVDVEEDEITAFDNDGNNMEFNFDGELTSWGN